jgi:hypothetical protein
MATNVPGIYGFGFPNMYQDSVAFNDYMYDNYQTDPFSMNGSVFGGAYPGMMPFTGMLGAGGVAAQSHLPLDPTAFMQYNRQLTKGMLDNQVALQRDYRSADVSFNAPMEGIRSRAAMLHDKIRQDEQEQIVKAFHEYIASVKNLYPDVTDERALFARAMTLYTQNTGKNILEDIRENSSGSFVQGFKQAVTFGISDNKTAEQNIAQLSGLPVGRGEQGKHFAGRVLGGAAVGAGAAVGMHLLWKYPIVQTLFKSKSLAMVVVGAAVGLVSWFAGKNKE